MLYFVRLYGTLLQAERGFVQKVIAGSDKGIGFSAYRGRLLGCVLCTKTISSSGRKLWCGELTSVPEPTRLALERFVHDCNWTGGAYILYFIASLQIMNSYDCNLFYKRCIIKTKLLRATVVYIATVSNSTVLSSSRTSL